MQKVLILYIHIDVFETGPVDTQFRSKLAAVA